MRILVVEDNRTIRTALAIYLRSVEHEVMTAGDITTAWDMACSGKFDLIVSDIELPDGNGLDLMRRLRMLGPFAGLAVSGLNEEWLPKACLDAGFSDLLTKPIRFAELGEAIRRIGRVPLAQP